MASSSLERLLSALTSSDVLRFGAFTLKSGRSSPYFLDFGRLFTGPAFADVIECYADTIIASGTNPEVIFGPAYKGIPLAAAVAAALARRGVVVGFAYDRKAEKDHGEGGTLVGAPLSGRRILIVDDVITAGTAIRGSLSLITAAGGTPVGVIVAVDRQEPGPDDASVSAIAALARDNGVPVFPIARVSDFLPVMEASPSLSPHVESVRTHLAKFGRVETA